MKVKKVLTEEQKAERKEKRKTFWKGFITGSTVTAALAGAGYAVYKIFFEEDEAAEAVVETEA